MKLLEQFYKYTSSQGIDKKDIYEKSAEDFTVVSFPEEGEKDCVYNIVLVFYDNDDDVEIYVRKVAPLGDPVEVTVRGYELSLRKADAEMIVVE